MSSASAPVTVVIPLYNKEREIARAIHSITTQTEPVAQIVVVDDGSTDGGADVVRQQSDPRIKLVQQDNAGPSTARNRGMAEAQTDLVALLDADDAWAPDFVATVLDLHRRFPEAGLWGTNFKMVLDADGAEEFPVFRRAPRDPRGGLVRDFFRASLEMPIVCCSGVLLSRAIIEEVGGFPEGERLGEDFDLWIRIALRYPVAYSPLHLAIYHKDADNRAMDREVHRSRDTCLTRTLTRALEAGRFTYTSRRSVKRLLGTHLLEIARSAIRTDNGPLARQLVREVVMMGVWPMRCLRRWHHSYRDCTNAR